MTDYVPPRQGDFTASRDAHDQVCPGCGLSLTATMDYSSGSNHYWVLVCGECVLRFTYDTYTHTTGKCELRPWPKDVP